MKLAFSDKQSFNKKEVIISKYVVVSNISQTNMQMNTQRRITGFNMFDRLVSDSNCGCGGNAK